MKTSIFLTLLCIYFESGHSIGYYAKLSKRSSHLASVNNEESGEFPWNKVRLPQSVNPLEYGIFLHPNLTEKKFSGKVDIKCEVLKSTKFVVLHSKNLNISKARVTTLPSNDVYEAHIRMKNDTDQLFLMLDESIPKDTEILITIVFHGILEVMAGKGFYLSEYLENNNEKRYFASTQFEAIEARRAFPCFDEPALKAKFSMSIVREKKHISLFNMPREHTVPMKNNLLLDMFQQSVKMSTYTVAFSVNEYEGKSKKTKSGVNVTVYAPRNDIGNVDYSLDAGVAILDYFDTLFGVQYPLHKLDMLAVPYLEAAAMENWGLITFKRALLSHSNKSGESTKLTSALVIAHEIAHQWFGNMVTMEWWDDIWLNEGLTTFMQYLGLQAFNKNWTFENEFVDRTHGMKCEDLTKTPVLDQPVDVPDSEFGCVSYNKGASIVRMIRSWLGEDDFMTGIKKYLKENKYGNVVNEDLWQALSDSSKDRLDVKSAMETWMVEKAYPVVTVNRRGSEISITQDPFIFANTPASKSSTKWTIPFWYGTLDKSGNFSRKMVMLREKTDSFMISDDAKLIKGNYGNEGYFRVNYDPESWKAIAAQLNNDHEIFSPGDRAHLLNDVITFTSTQIMNASIAIEMINYLEKEFDFLPWYSAFMGLESFLTVKEKHPENQLFLMRFSTSANKVLETIESKIKETNTEGSLQRLYEALSRVLRPPPPGMEGRSTAILQSVNGMEKTYMY